MRYYEVYLGAETLCGLLAQAAADSAANLLEKQFEAGALAGTTARAEGESSCSTILGTEHCRLRG